MPPKKESQKPAQRKRFTNGHVCHTIPEQNSLKECYNRFDTSRTNFNEKLPHMKKCRNVILGDATHRENPPALIDPSHLPRALDSEYVNDEVLRKSAASYNREHVGKGRIAKVDLVSTLKQKKYDVQDELFRLDQALEHKKLILSMTMSKKYGICAPGTDKGAVVTSKLRTGTSNPYIGELEP
jgi:hypothetical protein